MVYAKACDADSSFTINGVPPGSYQLAMWDKAVNYIIDYRTITVPATTTATSTVLDLGMIPIFSWFGVLQGKVFADAERTGTPWFQSGSDQGKLKPGIPNMLVNLRFTD